MAVIALGILRTVCLMCSALYLVNIGLFVAAWRLRAAVRSVSRRQQPQRVAQERLVTVGALVAVAALVAVGSWEAFGRARHTPDEAEIARERPEFYRWYVTQPMTDVQTDSSHSFGSADAAISIVEFSDFECGHCAAFHQSLEDVLHRGTEKVRVVFRHFPLDSACNPKVPTRLHPQACLAATAAECAGEQGKFWEYHNLLFENQQQLSREFLIGYAARLGLNQSRFSSCLSSDEARDRVQRDAEAGAQLGIDSTPTVFINGRMIKGALEPARLIDALVLARAGH
jgi:protein-disulfide isomerase